uniref:CAMK/CAMKL/KIN4 protein kinase n=1 Tax=Ganoderma boninense TaxID=34458 RepID=A0A5K1K1D1_9APHY|nr:CAMK/CAMKL/KIN4 protein kinase [Ganoderma boninense]
MPLIGGLNYIIYMNRPTSFILDIYHQIIEGIEYLHRLQIVHLDIRFENIASVLEYQASTDARLVPGKLYLIDFGQSRQLALGPGCQPAIVLPARQEDKPLELTTFDPYSFDIYCVGKVMQSMLLKRHSTQRFQRQNFLGYLSGTRNGWYAKSASARPSAAVVRLHVERVKY